MMKRAAIIRMVLILFILSCHCFANFTVADLSGARVLLILSCQLKASLQLRLIFV